MLCVRRWRDAGPAGRVNVASTLPRAQNRAAEVSTKTIHSAHLVIFCISAFLECWSLYLLAITSTIIDIICRTIYQVYHRSGLFCRSRIKLYKVSKTMMFATLATQTLCWLSWHHVGVIVQWLLTSRARCRVVGVQSGAYRVESEEWSINNWGWRMESDGGWGMEVEGVGIAWSDKVFFANFENGHIASIKNF